VGAPPLIAEVSLCHFRLQERDNFRTTSAKAFRSSASEEPKCEPEGFERSVILAIVLSIKEVFAKQKFG